MLRKDIMISELLECVSNYEKEVRNACLIKETDDKGIYRFKAARRDKLVIVISGGFVSSKQGDLLEKALKQIIDDSTLSDNIDMYTTGYVTEKRSEELEASLRQHGLSVAFVDQSKMEGVDYFSTLFENVEIQCDEKEIDPSFFDYLALSNDSSDIKNGFFYSLLLMEVYRHQPVSEEDFYANCQEKYGRSNAEIKLAVKNLRKLGKLTLPQQGGVFSLTDAEMRSIEASIRESRSEEASFKEALEAIVQKYGLNDVTTFYETLKTEYLNKYKLFSVLDDSEEERERKNGERWGIWNKPLKVLSDADAEAILRDLQLLCENNDYMDQYGLIHSFLELFRSDKYEGYIERKQHFIYLDTPVVVNYICAKSEFQDKYDMEWDDQEFNSSNDLFGYCEEEKDSITLVVPYDYMQEAIGELKKALQFSWFNQFENLPIPVETANSFYNYYLEVKKYKQIEDADSNRFTFEDFAKSLGFPELNTESLDFFRKNMAYLKHFLKVLGCVFIDKVEVNHNVFDDVKMDYVWYLHDKGKEKSDTAIKSDVRQAVHITKESISSNGQNEYYLVSWDNTLFKPRNKAKDLMEIIGRSYSIFKPGELAEKLAFRNFRFNKESVSREVFTYANTTYNVKDKIRSLYDNVLNPYFASFGKSNSALVLEVLKLQKMSMDGYEAIPTHDDKTALENIFLAIIAELSRHNCSTQNLKDYLNDESNNTEIIPLFTKAFDDYRKGLKVNIGKTICDMVKDYVSKDDKEIKL